jgi:hypothetical protein
LSALASEHSTILEQVGISSDAKEKGKADRSLGTPVLFACLVWKGERRKISESDEREEDAEECYRGGSFVEIAWGRLPVVRHRFHAISS